VSATVPPPAAAAGLAGRARIAVAAVLGVPLATVTAARSLLDLPGFDSVAVVALLDQLESELGVEVPPDLIVPEAFESIDALAGLLAHAVAGAPAAQPAAGGPAHG
jgi:acyl carrier protein